MKTNKIIKAIVNCRVSSREQQESGFSLDSQEKLLTEYARKNNFKIEKIYRTSESASGKQIRKTFIEMLQLATKNNVDVILCEKIDRLTRNLSDAAIVDDWIKGSQTRAVHFVKENFILNQQTKAHESLVWDMKVAIARFYTNNLGEEVRKGQKEKLAQGWLPMRAKLGYIISGEHKIHVIDNNKAPLIKRMFELYASGEHSLSTIVEKMKKEGLRGENNNPVSRTRMHELLSDPFYCGINVWHGEVYENAKQEPLVSKELFNLVQEKLSYKFGGKIKYRKHLPVFKSKVKCEGCGGMITWECQKGHWYGHCNHYRDCSQKKWVKQNEIEEQLIPFLIKVAPKNQRILEWLESALKESHVNEIDYNTNKREELNKIVRIADQRIEGAYRDKLDGRMPVALCEKIITGSNKEKEEAISSLGKLTESRAAYYEAGYSIHELALHAKEIYESPKATVEDRRLLLSKIFSNINLNEGKISVNYTLAFDFLTNWMPKVNNNFEPAILQDKTDLLRSVCTLKRSLWNEIRTWFIDRFPLIEASI